jgi:purine-cytosine permease-like protein
MSGISAIKKNNNYIELLEKIVNILVVMIILVGIITALFVIQFIDHYLFDSVYAVVMWELVVVVTYLF